MMNKKNQHGFTLIEMAVVLLITGLVLASATSMIKPYLDYWQTTSTRKKMEVVSNSLALYAQNYGRLPCPANPNPVNEPYGSPRNSGATGADIAKATCGPALAGNFIGVVPFRALGLSEDKVRDGYGHLFTYAVSQTMTEVDSEHPDPGPAINTNCSANPMWLQNGKIKNYLKAHICCPVPSVIALNIQVLDARGSTHSVLTTQELANPGNPGGGTCETYAEAQIANTVNNDPSKYTYDDTTCVTINDCGALSANCAWGSASDCTLEQACRASQPALLGPSWLKERTPDGTSGQGNQLGYNETYCTTRCLTNPGSGASYLSKSIIAYVLVSHGKNGDGAFIGQTVNRAQQTAANTAEESENRNDDMIFVDRQVSTTNDNNYFDDLVLWRTNDQLVSQSGSDSCAMP